MMYHAYLILLVAIVAENVGTTFLKGSNGLKRPVYVVGALSGYVVNFLMMGQVLALLPLAVVYGLWSGLGMAFVTLLGVLIYKEIFNRRVAIGLALIVAGVLVLNAA
jgi:small multidrug resistance pump